MPETVARGGHAGVLLDRGEAAADAVPTLAALLQSEHVELRRAAATLLDGIATEVVIGPLGVMALEIPGPARP